MNQSMDSHENRLRAAAQGLPYPPTPDIARAVLQRLAEVPTTTARHKPYAARRRFVLVAGTLILVLLAGLLAVPSVRAAVIEFLQVGVIRIILPNPTPTLTPTTPSISSSAPTFMPTRLPQPSPTPKYLIAINELQGETTLEAAMKKASFTLQLPTYPENLGEPQRVFVQDLGGTMVVMVWTAADNPENAALVLYQIAPESWAGEKSKPTSLEYTQVNGREAVWAEGPYVLYLTDGDLDLRRLIPGHTLIWEEGDITYRLESYLSLSQTIKIAESLNPIP
jgi:hypothetical protein